MLTNIFFLLLHWVDLLSLYNLCKLYFFCFTATNPATKRIATHVFNTALINAKICLSKGSSTPKVNLLRKVTTANTNIQATDRKYHVYRIEGQDLAPAGFGQAGTRYMTLSFWHKHTKTGIHSLAINNAARNRSYPMEYTQTTTNTWEKAELTFPVDTTGTWLGGNGIGMWIFFGAAFGSNYAGTVNQWGSSQKYGTANQVNNYDSTSNSMQFTGVQLELGKVATPFEHRSHGEELALCQRYFEKIEYDTSKDSGGGDAAETLICNGYAYTSTRSLNYLKFNVQKRVPPTVTLVGGANKIEVLHPTSGWVTTTSFDARANVHGTRLDLVHPSSLTAGYGLEVRLLSGGHIEIDAEA